MKYLEIKFQVAVFFLFSYVLFCTGFVSCTNAPSNANNAAGGQTEERTDNGYYVATYINQKFDNWKRLAVMHRDNTQWQRILKEALRRVGQSPGSASSANQPATATHSRAVKAAKP